MRVWILFSFLFIASVSLAQQEYVFNSGLAVSGCHRYGRQAVVEDLLAHQLYSDELKNPSENQKLGTDPNGNDLVWKKIETDSSGKFRGEILSGGYIYLVYQSDVPRDALLNVSGNTMCYFNGEPHAGDVYGDGWLRIPVTLKKGTNEILVRTGIFSRWQGVSARLLFPDKPIMISKDDLTLPHIVPGQSKENLVGALVIINNSEEPLANPIITSTLQGKTVETRIPGITKKGMRKVPFYFDPSGVASKGDYTCRIRLKGNGTLLDETEIVISAVTPNEHHSYTFVSEIDGSVQYYSVAPQLEPRSGKPALFLSVHGAGVEAIGQARAYQPKDRGVLVAPTNRRPRGFNWEDWGRMDALEVLALATKRFNPDPGKIYLTGHSMGGHGTWYLGATYPDKWAAIAPCAGYPTLTGYGSSDGKIPEGAKSETEKVLLRASNGSNVIDLAPNYAETGVYIHHGDSDKVVSVNYARQMREVLSKFHSDFSYYEYPGGSHWFGSESVDWPPLFEFFKWHALAPDTSANNIDFITTNPAISSSYRWASVIQQVQPLAYSEIHLVRDLKGKTVTGSTTNVAMLSLDLSNFNPGDKIAIAIDSVSIMHEVSSVRQLYLSGYPDWKIETNVNPGHKNASRYGTFKEAFNHRMIFVYGTKGSAVENQWAYNKARYDAEVWYYRGNGAVDLIPDTEFDLGKFPDRGVIIYGNAVTNSAWKKMLKDCPIQITNNRISLGSQIFEGADLAAYFTWPRQDSKIATVGVVAGTGVPGMRATEPNQYFAAGSGFPDYMIFSGEMLMEGAQGIRAAGFYNNEWKLDVSTTRADTKTKAR